MKSIKVSLIVLSLLFSLVIHAEKNRSFQLTSPDGKVVLKIVAGDKLEWSVLFNSEPIITPSTISMQLQTGEVLGNKSKIILAKTEKVNTRISTINYKKSIINDVYNQLSLKCKGNYSVIFRAYNHAVAYRFVTNRKDSITVLKEQANFNFKNDYKCFIPYVNGLRGSDPYIQSFEALYDKVNISKIPKDTIAFLPILVDLGNQIKAEILEADLENYPGMFLKVNSERNGFKGIYAPYPLAESEGGYRNLNIMVTKRANFIAKVNGNRAFPWRVVVLSDNDVSLANNDIVQELASPSRIKDTSWIKPGKAAWDWWSDWNISHVDFRAGINTQTYKYYIDFAAANKLAYIVIDEGWSNSYDLMKISPKINLQEIIDYAKKKNVGIILWASWYAVVHDMNKAFAKYSAMGVKGFKIDFFDRNDQKAVRSLYKIAKTAANFKLIVDYHGVYAPTGLQKTYPNVLGFEGVRGLEYYKWSSYDNVPQYAVTIPYIRMLAGPMDYTPGAMRNATQSGFWPNNSLPMSQGTRCNQMAMYIVFDSPLPMLSDNPTAYMKEQECTDFIDKIPTVFDQTIVLTGKVGKYIAVAKKKGDSWYIGAMNNWTSRNIQLDFSFLGEGNYKAEIFQDGINADRDATDYKKQTIDVSSSNTLPIHMAPGGGWCARIYKVK